MADPTGSGLSPAGSPDRLGLFLEGVKDYAIFMLDPGGRVSSWNGP